MLQSKLVGETKKEWPNEASIKSHGFMLKGGYIKQMASGIYTLMPLAKRVTAKIENIIREEMDKIDCQEIYMPVVATKKLWDMAGRYNSIGSELLKFKDRNDTDMVLSMTHEEATVFSMLNEGKSYSKYPFAVYQIQTKFRDEARPRAGLIRVREFTMKDAYSFHTSLESLNEEYDKYYNAYMNIYKRVGLKNFIAVASDTGMMGGEGAHEFMLLTDCGEDKIIVCDNCKYSANMEVAYTNSYDVVNKEESNLEKVYTEDIKTIDELTKFLNINDNNTLKAVVYERLDTHKNVIVFIRGDREVNETKLRNLIKVDDELLVTKKEDNSLCFGFIGPLNLDYENNIVVFDKSLENEKSLVCGANEVNYHFKGLNLKRDIDHDINFVDVGKVTEDDVCPICSKKSIKISNGIEIGNIFKLGDKYTKMMNMTYLDKEGKSNYPIMGCYGIGVGRLFASLVEERASESKIIYPISVAPFEVHILSLDYTKNDDVKNVSLELYNKLNDNNISVLLDDRNKSAGNKFADSDLIGSPVKIVIGSKNLSNDNIEVNVNDQKELVNKNDVYDFVVNKIKELKNEK